MDKKISAKLERKIKRLIQELNQDFGYCGAMIGDTSIIINSTDENKNDFIITVKVEGGTN